MFNGSASFKDIVFLAFSCGMTVLHQVILSIFVFVILSAFNNISHYSEILMLYISLPHQSKKIGTKSSSIEETFEIPFSLHSYSDLNPFIIKTTKGKIIK